jgi:choice-of-anchor B domain-containing protein
MQHSLIKTRLVFSSLVFLSLSQSQFQIGEPTPRCLPPYDYSTSLRIPNAELYHEWNGEPRWLTGVNYSQGQTFYGGIAFGEDVFGSTITDDDYVDVQINFSNTDTTWSQVYRRDLGYDAMGPGVFYGSAWDISDEENPRRLNICFVEWDDGSGEHPPDMIWNPDDSQVGRREYFFIMNSDYDGTGNSYDDNYYGPSADVLYFGWTKLFSGYSFLEADPSQLNIKLAYIRNFQAISGDQSIELSWEFDESDIDFFLLYFGDDPNQMEILTEINSEDRSFFHNGLENDIKYYYKLEGVSSEEPINYNSKTIHGIPHEVAHNMNLIGHLNSYSRYGDIWGYTHPQTGIEYALLCVRDEGLSIIELANEPIEVSFIPSMSPDKDAKDVKVFGHHAVLIKEYEPGQVIDLSDPSNPEVISTIHFGNNDSDGGAHNCFIDGSILYAIGHDEDGLEIYDLSDPENPEMISHYSTYYYHDIYVKDGLGYAAGIYGDGVDILDLNDLDNPQLLANFNYPASGAHNTWTTEDGNYVIVGDEIGGGPWTRIFDIQDLNNINMVSEYIVDEEAVVHNSYVKGNHLYVGHYTEGVRVVDITHPENPMEIAYYDTYLSNEYGYLGCWSVYPFFESGKIIASDMQSGLFVLTHDSGIQVGFMEGWNLIGLPIYGNDLPYNELYSGSIEGTLYGFDASYFPSGEVAGGEGYWLMFDQSATTTFSGELIDNYTISLNENWNMISGIGYAVEVNAIIDEDNLIIPGTVYGFDGGYFETETIEPGYGYWLRSSGEGEISLSSSAPLTKYRQFQPPENLNTLTVNTTSLYFGKDIKVENPTSYTLPPKPPEPSTDIRFSGDTKLCTSDECVIEVMNDRQPLVIECGIKEGESWEIIEENGNVFECSGVQVLEFDDELESFVLRKSNSPKVPIGFAFFPAHPNPFNPVTTIQFSVPELSKVKMSVYDIQGRLVETLVNEQLSPGNHRAQWNAGGVSSGIYIVLFEENEQRKIQKVVLMK